MFYIGYKSDYKTACRKQLKGAEYAGTAANGAEVYSVIPDTNWPDHRDYYYTVGGAVEGLCKALKCSPYITPEMMREQLAKITEEQAAKIFLDKGGEIDRIKTAIEAGTWTSNGDALFCEICGEHELAARARQNREEYRKRQDEKREAEQRERERQAAEQRAAEQKAKAEALERAEQELKAGERISAEHFEELAEKYGVNLSIKFIGWLRKWCGGVRIRRDENGERDIVYWTNAKHKSTSMRAYADKLGEACGI